MRLNRLLILLLTSLQASGAVVISEFMASNQSGIRDEDGDRPDWIELRNDGAEALNLEGWGLTDDPARPWKWTFPAVTLPPDGHLLVFASGKNRQDPGANLHTGFSLSASGEYLALVRPDGTAATEFAPAFPPQFPDVSYGTSTNSTDVTLVGRSTPVRSFVPADTSLIPAWRMADFSDSAWATGTFGVGYFNSGADPNLSGQLGIDFGLSSATPMAGTGRHSYSRARFPVNDPGEIVSLRLRVNYDDGFVAWINGHRIAASAGTPASDPISPTATVPNHGPDGFEEFALQAGPEVLVSGTNVFAIEGFNTSVNSSDAFVMPALTATLRGSGGGVTGYFPVPTPGRLNGGRNTIELPVEVHYSRPSGTFVGSFDLVLTGAGEGQVIRYNLSGPSPAGADLPPPDSQSTLYEGPIRITGSTLIRAAVFEGDQRGRTKTAQFVRLETSGAGSLTLFRSNLPVIVLDDHGDGQPVDSGGGSWTTTMMHVFVPSGGVTRLTDPETGEGRPETFTRAGTRVRGSSSAGFDKKSYGLETWDEHNEDRDCGLLGLAEDSDWILNGPYLFDDTYIHNAFIYEISRLAGRWAPRTRFCEVFFNQNGGSLDAGDYAGIYVLTEKIKSTRDRLSITGIQPGDTSGEALTGGYIFKIDRADSNEYSWTIDNSAFTGGRIPSESPLVLVEPDPDEDQPEQLEYIRHTVIGAFNTALFTERAAGFRTRNYRSYIDSASFVDHHILNSVAYNVDALRLSAFFFKDRGGRINAGPLWDFDRALGSDDGRDANPASWANIEYFFTRDWWGALFDDPLFVQEWVDRWVELRRPGRPLDEAVLHEVADRMGSEIGNAAGARDAARWSANAPSGGVYLNEISQMKQWLTRRLTFIDAAVPQPPGASLPDGQVSPGTTVTLTGSGIRYTTDGSDPLVTGGNPYTGPVPVSQSMTIVARRQGSFSVFPGAVPAQWSAPLRRVYTVDEEFAQPGDLVVTEIHYHPLGPDALEAPVSATGSDYEWIELRNPGSRTVNVQDVTFAAGYPFPEELKLGPLRVEPGEFVLVVRNRAAFEARYGTGVSDRIAAEWTGGALANDSGEIRILARDGTPMQRFLYGSGPGWPDRADGTGAALEYAGAGLSDAEYSNPGNWRSSGEVHGSPGAPGAGREGRIVINELLTGAEPPLQDAIELRNLSDSPVDVGGWYLTDAHGADTADDYRNFRIPAGTVVPAGGYLVVTEDAFHPAFALDGWRGGDVWLLQADGDGRRRMRFADHVEFGAARPGESLGRWPDGSGPLRPMAARTLLDESSAAVPRPGAGAPNAGPRSGPVILREIHHSPPAGGREFIELFNAGADVESLAGWQLTGSVLFDFPDVSIPAHGQLVLVPFATGGAEEAAFRDAYGVAAEVALAGPWNGSLDGAGELVLYRAWPPPPDPPPVIPRTIEDRVRFSGTSDGWPLATEGRSLHRIDLLPGDEASSWEAMDPSPGIVPVVGDPGYTYDRWVEEHFAGGSANSHAAGDPDGDGLVNLLEYAFGTNPAAPTGPGPLPVLTVEGDGQATFTWTARRDRADLTFAAEVSADGAAWTEIPSTVTATTEESETRAAALPAGARAAFARLKVVLSP